MSDKSVMLRPMTEAEFPAYLEHAVREYANEKVAAGNWKAEEALERSHQEFLRLLPNGVASPNNHLFIIEDADTQQRAGILWFIVNPGVDCFVLDFEIDEASRRQGYASGALAELATMVRSMGIDRIRLHVFGNNHAARALYQKAGFVETNVNMVKRL